MNATAIRSLLAFLGVMVLAVIGNWTWAWFLLAVFFVTESVYLLARLAYLRGVHEES